MSKRHSSNGLSFIHLNAQSLFAHIDDFRADLASHFADVALISETWLNTSHSDAMISVSGYKLYRNDRADWKRGGGVAIYLKKHLKCSVLSKSSFSVNCCEFMMCEISNKYDKMLVGCVYKPPNCTSLESFYGELPLIAGKYVNILIGGDFNINIIQTSSIINDYKTQINSFGLHFVNSTQATHFQSSPSLLDHFLISDSELVLMYQQLSAPVYSKHDLLYLVYEFPTHKESFSTYSYRNFKVINHERLSSDIQSVNWSNLLQLSLDSSVQFLEGELNRIFDEHVPLVTKKVSSFDNPWMTNEIRQLRTQRDLAFVYWKLHRLDGNCLTYRQNYNRLRNLVTSKIRSTKAAFFNTKLDPRQPAKDLWKQLRSIGVAENKLSCELDPNSFINSFFPFTEVPPVSDFVVHRRPAPSFKFHNVSNADVIFAFHSMRSNATGLDMISLKFIKHILPLIIDIITHVINRCIDENYFPTSWKIAKVIAVPKKGGDEFRPISILPCFSKAFEKIMSTQIIDHLHVNKLQCKLQSGFRKFHSCKSAILEVSEVIRNALDVNEAVILVLIDFSKAFDTIIHSLLIDKLKLSFGFNDESCGLLQSYFHNRTSYISSNNCLSQQVRNVCGVPQGSILGPLLFSLYIDDMSRVFNKSTPHFYADDTQIFLRCQLADLPQSIHHINSDLQKVSEWSSLNGLRINASKTQSIVFTRKSHDISTLPSLVVNGTPVIFEEKVNNLGVLMSSHLSWDHQIIKSTGTIYYGLRCLWNNAHILPRATKLKLAQSLLCPHLIAADVITGELSSSNFMLLQRAFNGIIRFVHGLRKYDHISHLSASLVGLPLNQFLRFRRIVFLFNMIKNKQPVYLYRRLEFSRSNRLLNINVPVHEYDFVKKSFFVGDIIFWNQLPPQIKNSTSVNMFKVNLKCYLSSQ